MRLIFTFFVVLLFFSSCSLRMRNFNNDGQVHKTGLVKVTDIYGSYILGKAAREKEEYEEYCRAYYRDLGLAGGTEFGVLFSGVHEMSYASASSYNGKHWRERQYNKKLIKYSKLWNLDEGYQIASNLGEFNRLTTKDHADKIFKELLIELRKSNYNLKHDAAILSIRGELKYDTLPLKGRGEKWKDVVLSFELLIVCRKPGEIHWRLTAMVKAKRMNDERIFDVSRFVKVDAAFSSLHAKIKRSIESYEEL